ncbi:MULTISPECIES: M56 family metallopeptidase [Bacillus]|uniref:Bla regulator protein BlaR1 n=1 Tax=Bacillus mycoides TaxID=1405 RepID=A0A3D9USP5_BACMY|nr:MULTISPECIES: M56 family metallopeptidase [Bacillus]RBP25834.1 bla regulator protein BlaR1 [Bacillus sp. DB-2]REF29014.1 bla regulator protein BlaR1 [Bacillus mycoides]
MLYAFWNIYLPVTFEWIIDTSVMASILIILLLCLKVVLRNRLTARWHYLIWFILMIRLISPWSPDSSYSIYSLLSKEIKPIHSVLLKNPEGVEGVNSTVNTTSDFTVHNSQESNTNVTDDTNHGPKYETSPISVYETISYIWLLGILCCILVTLVVNKKLSLYIRKQPLITDKRIIDIFNSCKHEMKIKKNIPLIFAGKLPSPTLVGIRKPCILLTEKHIDTLNDNQLRFIFYHELSHYKRKDVGINLIMHHLVILHWFNPIIWYASKCIREDQEIACDALALTYVNSEDNLEYGHTIIALLEQRTNCYPIPTVANLSRNKHNLKRRIVMIKKFNKKSYRLSALGIVCVIGVSTFALMNAKAEESSSKKAESQIIKSGEQSTEKQLVKNKEGNQSEQKKTEQGNESEKNISLEQSDVVRGDNTGERNELIRHQEGRTDMKKGIPVTLKLTEKQRQSLIDRGFPKEQTAEEFKSTNLVLVSLVKSVVNEEGIAVRPPHVGEVDVIPAEEYETKYGKTYYVYFQAWK